MIAEMHDKLVRDIETEVASMGPRSNDRGNEICGSRCAASSARLQWGRDQMIAEMSTQSSGTGASLLLQWGRDQMIAEITSQGTSAGKHRGSFNGAAIK